MPPPTPTGLTPLLHRALQSIQSTPPRLIASPPTQPRRASVAIIIRVRPPPSYIPPSPSSPSPAAAPADLQSFFSLPWVRDPRAVPELLYIERAARTSDRWSSHVAFPGGRMEDDDESAVFTAMRETYEELGLDLAERDYLCIGQLDDREITTSLGKRLLMILSPFVFLQTTPSSPVPDLSPAEVASLHWIPLPLLHPFPSSSSPAPSSSAPPQQPKWGTVLIDISSRLAPRSRLVRWALWLLVGNMHFRALMLPDRPEAVARSDLNVLESATAPAALAAGVEGLRRRRKEAEGEREADRDGAGAVEERPELRLWGLTLGMTLDLLSHLPPTSASSPHPHAFLDPLLHSDVPPQRVLGGSGSLTSVFPRFSTPDTNFWIWVFGRRYRQIVRNWERAAEGGVAQGMGMGAGDQRINWAGMALSAFYAAVRKALIVAIVLRALAAVVVVGGGVAWAFGWLRWGR